MSKKFYPVFVLLLATANIALAQDTTAISRRVPLNPVVITATKFLKKTSETGQSVIVITQQQLQHHQGESLAEILNEQPGIVVNGAGSNLGKDKSIYLRGAGNDYAVILVDGIPLSDPSGPGGAYDLRLIPTDEIQRIEIVKGGLSTLYGSDAVAGVINIITKKGGTTPIGAYGTLGYGSYQTFHANAGINGKANFFGYNINYDHLQTAGISEATDTTGKMDFDKDGLNQNAVSANFSFQLSKKLQVNPFFRYTYYNGQTDAGSFTDSKDGYVAKSLNSGATAEYKLLHGGIDFNYVYEKLNREYISAAYGNSAYEGLQHQADIYWHQNAGNYFQWLIGTAYRFQKMPDTTATKKNPSVYFISPYVAFFLRNYHGWNLELGGRLTHHSQYGNNVTFTFNPAYLFKNKWQVYISAASSFKAPDLSMLYGEFSPNPELKPEQSISYEAGLHIPYGQNKGKIHVDIFKRYIKNVIVYTPAAYINQDKQHNWGFEYEQSYEFSKSFSMKAWYAFMHGNVTTVSAGKDSTYNNLFRIPKSSLGLSLQWQPVKHLSVDPAVSFNSARQDLNFNTYPYTEVTLKAYALLNVNILYHLVNDKMELFADFSNITNTHYVESYGYNTMGFHVMAGIHFKL